MKRSAFTLVELLVCVAVTLLLAALLIPVAGSLRNRSRETACASNLHGLAMAGHLFAADWGGFFPTSRLANGDQFTEPGLREYLGNDKFSKLFTCPVLARLHSIPEGGQTYTVSLAATNNIASWGDTPLRRLNRVEAPSKMAWIMDGAWLASSNWFSSAVLPSDRGRFEFPHRGCQNVVFVDGHVERISPRDERWNDETSTFWTGRTP